MHRSHKRTNEARFARVLELPKIEVEGGDRVQVRSQPEWPYRPITTPPLIFLFFFDAGDLTGGCRFRCTAPFWASVPDPHELLRQSC
jgi:hypothetical protein